MNTKQAVPGCVECAVRCYSIFSQISQEEIEKVNYIKDASLYKKGQIIFSEGNHPKGIFIVHSGKVKVFKLGSGAKDQIVRLAKPGDVLGYRALISNDRYQASAAALEDSIICFIPREQLFKFLGDNADLSIKLMKLLSNDLAIAEKKMVQINQKPVRDRLAEAILNLKEIYGLEKDNKTLNVILTREELGNYVGTTTETTIRILSDFKDENLISFDKKKIVIEDLSKLIHESRIND